MCICVGDVDGRSDLVGDTCSSSFDPFCLFINFQLNHTVFTSGLSQHSTMNFSRLHVLCPQKSHYGDLFRKGAISQRSVHVFLSSARLRAECYAVPVPCTRQPLRTCCIAPASTRCVYSLTFKLPFVFSLHFFFRKLNV